MKKILILLILLAAVAFYVTQVRGDKPSVDPATQYSTKIEGYKDKLTAGLNQLETEVFDD